MREEFHTVAELIDLNVFLVDANEIDCPKVFAARASLMMQDITNPAYGVVCIAIVTFLQRTCRNPRDRMDINQQIRDLVGRQKQGITEENALELFSHWYE